MVSEVKFDPAVFSVDVIKAACYRFSDKFSTAIEIRDGLIVCALQFDTRIAEPSIETEINNLKKEVLDQDLRLRLKSETEPVRNLILAHAFSKTGLIADE
jgi:His-Xaa-Ser system protein HxsD